MPDQHIMKSGCETVSKIVCSLISIFLSETIIRESHSIPTTSLAFRINLLSLLVWIHSGVVVSTVALEQEGPWFVSWVRAFLCEVCRFSLNLRGVSLGTP